MSSIHTQHMTSTSSSLSDPSASSKSQTTASPVNIGSRMRLASNKENAPGSSIPASIPSTTLDRSTNPSKSASNKPRMGGIGRPRAAATRYHPVLLKGKRGSSIKKAKVKAVLAKKRRERRKGEGATNQPEGSDAIVEDQRTSHDGFQPFRAESPSSTAMNSEAVSLSPLGITSPQRFSRQHTRSGISSVSSTTMSMTRPDSASSFAARLPTTPDLLALRTTTDLLTPFSKIPSGLLSKRRASPPPPIRPAPYARPDSSRKPQYWATSPTSGPSGTLPPPRRLFSSVAPGFGAARRQIPITRSISHNVQARIQARAPQFVQPGQQAQPPPPPRIHPVAQHPFNGLHIGASTYAHYMVQLADSVKEPLDQYGPGGEVNPHDTPGDVYEGNRYNPVLAARYRKYIDEYASGRNEGIMPPIMVPVLERFTTLFPATPARYLLSLDGNVVYPFHVLPRKLVIPPIPPVTHTMENGSKVPVDYVFRNLVDHLPLVHQTTNLYSLAPQHMQRPATRINTPTYDFGTRIDDTHDTITFWNTEAVSHGGLNPDGRRLCEMRGPNVVLVVRQDGNVTSPGTLVPVNKTVLAMQCSHFTRLINQGRSLRSRGDANSNWANDNAARRKVSCEILSARAMQRTSLPISKILSPDSIPVQPVESELDTPPTASNATETDAIVSTFPAGTRAPSLYIIPTPPIAIRRTTDSPCAVPHVPSSSFRARHGTSATGQLEAEGHHSEPESDGAYSVHVTSDIGSVSCITSDSADSDDDESGDEGLGASHAESETIVERVAIEGDIVMHSDSSASLKQPTSSSHPLYNSVTPLIGEAVISPGNTHELYGIKSLPILSLYIPDLSTLSAILRHLHYPKESLLPALLGWDRSANITTTSALQVRLYEISAYDLLVRAERFYRFVKNLVALGIGAKSTWDQVHVAHNCLNQVLCARGALPNPHLNKIAVPYMDGEGLPGLVFSTYTNEMIDAHNHWRAMREVKAQTMGMIPPEE